MLYSSFKAAVFYYTLIFLFFLNRYALNLEGKGKPYQNDSDLHEFLINQSFSMGNRSKKRGNV